MKCLGLPLFGDAHHPLRQCSRLYHEDLQCLENGKVLHPGAVIVADNVRCLGMRGGVGAGVWGFNVLSLFFLGGGTRTCPVHATQIESFLELFPTHLNAHLAPTITITITVDLAVLSMPKAWESYVR